MAYREDGTLIPDPPESVATGPVACSMFAIMNRKTGEFLPEGKGRRGRGITHQDPTPAEIRPPKLFKTRRGAQQALKWWSEGKWTEYVSFDFEDDYGDLRVKPQPDRNIDDYRVIVIHLVKGGIAA